LSVDAMLTGQLAKIQNHYGAVNSKSYKSTGFRVQFLIFRVQGTSTSLNPVE